MAAINELIDQIENPELRKRIMQEVGKLQKQKKFGLVYEEHIPEATPLYDVPVKRGTKVMLRGGKISEIYRVISITGDDALCERMNESHEQTTLPKSELVVVAHFGEPIFPYLKYKDSICNAPDSDLWHTLIEADNYHALQLLSYLYAGKVDCIYIDPPYNSGSRDWKYNNDYVDDKDEYRHSKWLSMMEKRLNLAKKLLNPKDSVLIVTIDEKEYLHLGCLLEQLFRDAKIQMISSVINGSGSSRGSMFSRTDEYIFFIFIGSCAVQKNSSDMLHEQKKVSNPWHALMRGGATGLRTARPNLFYPLYFKNNDGSFYGIGDILPLETKRQNVHIPDNCFAIFPLNAKGQEVTWGIEKSTFEKYIKLGYILFGKWQKKKNYRSVKYLQSGTITALENNLIEVVGKNEEGSLILQNSNKPVTPMTTWVVKEHNATSNGTNLLKKFIGEQKFAYPKSLYAVRDTIRFFVANKPNALILDFFAGSGTTLHAVNLLNAEDGGHRRCIMVTNNEVSEAEAKELTKKGFKPGDDEWEKIGIANYVTWERTKCSINGTDINGDPIKGKYIGTNIPMADGFKSNAAFFKLGFLDKTAVSLGLQLKELIPTLWMKAGSMGKCPTINGNEDYVIFPANKFAILVNECEYVNFELEMREHPEIEVVYIITNSEAGYREMIASLQCKATYQLYRDYLDNFSINYSK